MFLQMSYYLSTGVTSESQGVKTAPGPAALLPPLPALWPQDNCILLFTPVRALYVSASTRTPGSPVAHFSRVLLP